jgi:3-phytase
MARGIVLLLFLELPLWAQNPFPIFPSGETQGVANRGDSDDPAIWVDPKDPSQSLIVGTYKRGGLGVFKLSGELVQFLPDGRFNNVDLIQIEGRDYFVSTERSQNKLFLYEMVEKRLVARGSAPVGFEPYGICLYQNPKGSFAFVTSKAGPVQQFAVSIGRAGLSLQPVRKIPLTSQTEGCVADPDLKMVYIGEEDQGIWRFGADPDSVKPGVLMDRVGSHITADVEGISLFHGENGHGYLIVSSQGSNSFALYERTGHNRFIGLFTLEATDKIDQVTATDGLDIAGVSLSPTYEEGLLVVHDDSNEQEGPNFKLVSWKAIREAFDLPQSPL